MVYLYTKKDMINRRLKHVKPPEEIKRKLTRFLNGQSSKKLLKQWIEVDPIVALNDDGTKAKYEPSIKKHWLEVCKESLCQDTGWRWVCVEADQLDGC